MKKLLAIIILSLCFITPFQADDIRDFEIEGVSLGESLLNSFSEKAILEDKPNWFKNKDYSIANNLRSKNFETYEFLQIAYKTEDKKYVVEGIEGFIFFSNLDDCLDKIREIDREISGFFTNVKRSPLRKHKHNNPDNSSIIHSMNFRFKSGASIGLGCSLFKDLDPPVDLRVILRSNDYAYFLKHYAYK